MNNTKQVWEEFVKALINDIGFISNDITIIQNLPIPDEILYIKLPTDDCWSDDYQIEYRVGDKYYIAEDSHCSCYGFSDFDPEEYTEEQYLAIKERRRNYSI